MDNPTTDTPSPKTSYGNLEVTVEGMNQEQLDHLLAFVTEKVESMKLVMVARTYMTTDDDYSDPEAEDTEETEDAQKTESTKEG
jgi:hypothetical protein